MNKNIYNDAMLTDQRRTSIKNNLLRGIRLLNTEKGKKYWLIYVLLAILYVLFRKRNIYIYSVPFFATINTIGVLLFTFIVFPIIVCYLLGEPWKYSKIEKAFIQSGVVNRADEPPMILNSRKENNATVYSISAKGVAPTMWAEAIPTLQTAINCNIAKVIESKDKSTFEMWTVPTDTLLDFIPWDKSVVNPDDAIINIGRGYLGDVSYNCDINPHACIVASSGGGKTRLLFSIIVDFLSKSSTVYVVDLKGGADFKRFGDIIHLATTEWETLDFLKTILNEMERRKKLFYDNDVSNITEYRRKTGDNIQRILFCVDEAVQLLDKTGLRKEDKVIADEIERYIQTISQIGRSFGVSLILAGQRLDRSTISPKIFNNLDIKIAGRCDDVLSQIMFGDKRADELIPKNSRGLFVNQDNVLFRAYYFE